MVDLKVTKNGIISKKKLEEDFPGSLFYYLFPSFPSLNKLEFLPSNINFRSWLNDFH